MSACETQPTPTKAHVRMPSLPFELSRLLHGASVRQFSCPVGLPLSLSIGRHSFPLPCTVRTQAAPCPGNVSAEIQKAGPIGVFTWYSTTLVPRWDASRGHDRVMTCCRVIDCPEKHVCTTGTLHNRGQVVDFFSSGVCLYAFYRFSSGFHRNLTIKFLELNAYINLYFFFTKLTGTLIQNFQLRFIP